MVRTIAFSVVLLIALSQAVALVNTLDVKFDTAVEGECLEFNGRCCTGSACSIKYTLSGRWETQTGQNCEGVCTRCENICLSHTMECQRKCSQLFRLVTQESSSNCKCVRDLTGTEALRAECTKECSKASTRCLNGCEKSTCPLVAKLTMNFDVVVPGKCKPTCATKFFPAPAACPNSPANQGDPEPSMEESM